jgi:glycerol-3-phosphate dehydrogenase subunit B
LDDEYDVLIIGGGMAGIVAGITAAESGASVLVVRKGEGATTMSSGAIDIAGYMIGGTAHFLSPAEGLVAYSELYPLHPYSSLDASSSEEQSKAESVVEAVRESVEWISHLLQNSSSEFVGTLDRTILALTLFGTRKPTCLLQRTMYTDRLDNEDETLLFAGIKGLQYFSPSSAAKTMMDAVISKGEGPRKIIHSYLECRPFQKNYNISPIELARYLETEEGLSQFTDQLVSQAKSTSPSLIALPPILGIKHPAKIRAHLEAATDAEVFELLAVPPSVPGYRLERSLEIGLERCGGKLLLGHEASRFIMDERHISRVTCRSPRRAYDIHPKSVVLATGKLIGGGIDGSERGMLETVFGLPVLNSSRMPVSGRRPHSLTEVISVQPEGHELFECGIGFDEQLRPIEASGGIYADNLFAAGSVLSGYNYPAEKSGLGVALATGRAAGMNAVASIKGVSR